MFAIPLFLAPEWFLGILGWSVVDPFASRLVSAALFGIGGVSLLARKASKEAYQHLLMLKLAWSGTAVVGMFITLLQGAPVFGWVVLALFAAFFCVWLYYVVQLKASS